MRSADDLAPVREWKCRSRARGPGHQRRRREVGIAVVVLAAVVVVPTALALLASPNPPDLEQKPPYPLPSVTGTDRAGGVWDPREGIQGPTALLYVSERCPYCRRELAHWDALRRDGAQIPLWIVSSPDSEFAAADWVPAGLRERIASDPDGAIARALGVRAVPATLWVDTHGMVRAQRLGASSPRRIREEFRALGQPQAPAPTPSANQPPSSGGCP